MCMVTATGLGALGWLRRDQKGEARNTREENWKRDDLVMDKQHAHEQSLADKQYGVWQPGESSRKGGSSKSGSSKSGGYR